MTAITKDVVIGKYVALRDQIKEISERHSAELAPFNEQMEKIEAWLLANLNQDGVDSYKTAMGTAYKSTTMSARMEDRESFMAVVLRTVAGELMKHIPVPKEQWAEDLGDRVVQALLAADWSLADVRVNKTGVKEFMEMNGGQVPPGVTVEHVTKVNVRRAS